MIWVLGGTTWEVTIQRDTWVANRVDNPKVHVEASGREALISLIEIMLREAK